MQQAVAKERKKEWRKEGRKEGYANRAQGSRARKWEGSKDGGRPISDGREAEAEGGREGGDPREKASNPLF